MKKFEGYYFRHITKEYTAVFIPGISDEGAFIQFITDSGSEYYRFDRADISKDAVVVGENRFCKGGIQVNLPDVKGNIRYTDLTPIMYDIMGPFRFFPMECRHKIVSMGHGLRGNLEIGGKNYSFDGGIGYIEGDSGRSFPKEYLWVQANDFENSSGMVLSVAKIPFCGFTFDGVICIVMYAGKEYRLATYLGAKAYICGRQVTVRQKNLVLQAEITPGGGFELKFPHKGKMSGIIRECNNAVLHFSLKDSGNTICDLTSSRAAYERHPKSHGLL